MKRLMTITLGVIAISGVLAGSAVAAAPSNTTLPVISGKEMTGSTLTVTNGQWTGNPADFDYQWQRCNRSGESCGNISGQTNNTYKLTDSDVGNTVRAQVTAKNSDGATMASAKVTEVISGDAAPRVTQKPTISGKPAVGETLTADPGVWAEGPTFSFQWQQCDKNGGNCKDINAGRPVTGALVYALGVPSNRVSVANEVTTDSTGWASVTFNPLRAMPLKRGAQLTFFVRARKAGENPLAGISTRRLVSVRISP